jgi:RimJ/RimL family protein N-acetyltransferase
MLVDSPESIGAFRVPPDWPDREGLDHIERWKAHAVIDGGASPWRARAVVDATGQMVGHAGFHGPPVSVEEALADPTSVGTISPCNGGVVELGYSIFTGHRRKGYASEAVTGLIGWAFRIGCGAVRHRHRAGRQRGIEGCSRPRRGFLAHRHLS